MDLAHLHVHSYYSFLEGIASPAELARSAARSGMAALALTDHLNLTGAIEFYNACSDEGMKPIFGVELEVEAPFQKGFSIAPSGTLVFLAMDSAGWRSLCRLSSAVLAYSEDASRIFPFEILSQEAGSLICLTGGSRGLISKIIETSALELAQHNLHSLEEVFQNRLYIELPPGGAQDQPARQALRIFR